jgi:hypothetical protein
MLVRPSGGVTADLAQHPFADWHDQADLLGDWDEFAGYEQAAAGPQNSPSPAGPNSGSTSPRKSAASSGQESELAFTTD